MTTRAYREVEWLLLGQKLGLTVYELGEIVNVTGSTVSKWEGKLKIKRGQAVEPLTDAELLQDLKSVAQDLEKTPSAPEYNKHAVRSSRVLHKRFGNWREACIKAGLPPNQEGTVNKEDALNDYKKVAEDIEKVPSQTEYEKNGNYNKDTLIRKFGSWNAVAKAAGFKPNVAHRGTGDSKLNNEQWLTEQYKSGRSLLSIAEELDCSGDAVRYRLKSYQVEMRSRSNASIYSDVLEEEVDSAVELLFAKGIKAAGLLDSTEYHPPHIQTKEGRWEPDFLVNGWMVECKDRGFHGKYAQKGKLALVEEPVLLFGRNGDANELDHNRFIEYKPGSVPDLKFLKRA